ncbi:hypothetical protein PFISCL1PPCAC_26454, partial [Pristionchus fissidentatus]
FAQEMELFKAGRDRRDFYYRGDDYKYYGPFSEQEMQQRFYRSGNLPRDLLIQVQSSTGEESTNSLEQLQKLNSVACPFGRIIDKDLPQKDAMHDQQSHVDYVKNRIDKFRNDFSRHIPTYSTGSNEAQTSNSSVEVSSSRKSDNRVPFSGYFQKAQFDEYFKHDKR